MIHIASLGESLMIGEWEEADKGLKNAALRRRSWVVEAIVSVAVFHAYGLRSRVTQE